MPPKAKPMNGARLECERGRWSLVVDSLTPEQKEELHAIPGLYAAPGKWAGSIDAVAAGALVLGLEPPNPLSVNDGTEVQWPPQARPYQAEGITRLVRVMSKSGGAILADDMGLGKTFQARVVAENLGMPVFIICPGSVRETWLDDLTKWGVKRESIAVLRPPARKADQAEWARAGTCDWVITSYELAKKAFELAFSDASRLPNVVLVDEAHKVKSRKGRDGGSFRAEVVEEVSGMSPYKLLMTGTPVDDRPRDLYRLLRIALGTTFGASAWNFDERYCDAKSGAHGERVNTGKSNTEELKLRLSYYMVRRKKSDVLKELPPLTRQVRWVDGTPEAGRLFHGSLRKEGVYQDAIKATLKGKMQPCLDMAAELKQFLLFTWLREHARDMAAMLQKEGTPCVCITGDDDHQTRQSKAKLAAANGWGVVATLDSCGTGMDVLKHVASTGIFHALHPMPQLHLQAEARLHRMGVVNPVNWYYFAMRDSIDELLMERTVSKLDAAQAIVGGAEGVTDDLSGKGTEAESMKALFELLSREE